MRSKLSTAVGCTRPISRVDRFWKILALEGDLVDGVRGPGRKIITRIPAFAPVGTESGQSRGSNFVKLKNRDGGFIDEEGGTAGAFQGLVGRAAKRISREVASTADIFFIGQVALGQTRSSWASVGKLEGAEIARPTRLGESQKRNRSSSCWRAASILPPTMVPGPVFSGDTKGEKVRQGWKCESQAD